VNTTVACAAIGCTANATLQAFDATREEAWNCRLNIGVHATDYDDDWSRENIDFWTVNGYIVRAHCDPMARGCNSSASRPLYSCLNDFQVDHIVGPTGAFQLQGTLSRMVDECPYEGNLLSGVAQVTCLVRPRPSVAPAITSAEWNEGGQLALRPPALDVNASFRCSKPGCAAITSLHIPPELALLGSTCLMNVSVAQTDFDDHLGVPEQLDFVSLRGVGNLSVAAQPGRNPCTADYQGVPLPPEQLVYSVISNYNVTDFLRSSASGLLVVEGKISEMVDECASQGEYLLDGLVTVHCEPPAVATAAAVVAAGMTTQAA